MYLVNSEKNNYLSFSLHELWGFKVVASIEATTERTGSEGVSGAHGLRRLNKLHIAIYRYIVCM